MRPAERITPQVRQHLRALQTARWSTAALGAALLLWGLAPTLVILATNRQSWSFDTLLTGGLTMGVGAAFLALAGLMRQVAAWPLWAACVLAFALCVSNVGLLLLAGPHRLSVFPLLLAGCCAATTWLAIDAQRRVRPRPAPAS